MALAAWQAGAVHAFTGVCGVKSGHNCTLDVNGNCSETKCVPGQSCNDMGCVKFHCKQSGC
jgi:hypothetical protein